MDELHHECGVAAIYHLPGRGDKLARLDRRPGPGLAADAADAARHAEPRPARRRDDHATTRTASKLLDTYKEIGTVIEAFRLNHPAQVRRASWRSTPAGPPSATSATPPAAPTTAATPSRSSGSTAASGSGSRFAFNGQLANYAELRDKLLADDDYHLDARHRHRNHHARHQPRAARRRPARPGGGVPQAQPTKFDGAYNLVFLNADGRHGRRPRPARAPAAVLRQEGPLFAAASESVAAAEPRLPRHPVARAGRDDRHPGRRSSPSSGSPSRSGRPTASSSGSTSPTSPARSTTAASTCRASALGEELARQERSWAGAARRRTRSSCRCRTPARPPPTRWRIELGVPSRRRADPQPLRRPDVHRGRRTGPTRCG